MILLFFFILIILVNVAFICAINLVNKSKILLILFWMIYAPVLTCSILLSISLLTEIGSRERGRRMKCANNLKQIGLSLRMYASDNNGSFPNKNGAEGFEMLRSLGYLENLETYQCPTADDKLIKEKNRGLPVPPLKENEIDYEYRGGFKDTDSKLIPIAWDKPNNHKKFGSVLFINGRVIRYEGADWLENTRKIRTPGNSFE